MEQYKQLIQKILNEGFEKMDSLCNKSGFDDWWYNLDDDT